MLDVLVVAPHPDDAELGMAGAIMKFKDDGWRVGILDLTNGEPTPLGSPEIRARETEAATAELDSARTRFAKVLRTLQTNDDYIAELMEIRQGEEALKVVRDLAKQIHEASDMLNNFIKTITPPQSGT